MLLIVSFQNAEFLAGLTNHVILFPQRANPYEINIMVQALIFLRQSQTPFCQDQELN